MFVKSTVRTVALWSGAVFMLSAASLSAAVVQSQKVVIPFEFHVDKQSLPAGQYRVEQTSGSDIATLVNLQNGHRYQFLRPDNIRKGGKATLQFEAVANGVSLKKIS